MDNKLISLRIDNIVVLALRCEECNKLLTPWHSNYDDTKEIDEAVSMYHREATGHQGLKREIKVCSLKCFICGEILIRVGEWKRCYGDTPEMIEIEKKHRHGGNMLYTEFALEN